MKLFAPKMNCPQNRRTSRGYEGYVGEPTMLRKLRKLVFAAGLAGASFGFYEERELVAYMEGLLKNPGFTYAESALRVRAFITSRGGHLDSLCIRFRAPEVL